MKRSCELFVLIMVVNVIFANAQFKDKHTGRPASLYVSYYGIPFQVTVKKDGVAILDNNVNESLKDVAQINLSDFSNGRYYVNREQYDSAIYYFEKVVERGRVRLVEAYLMDLTYLNLSLSYLFKSDHRKAYDYLKMSSDNEYDDYSCRSLKGFIYFMARDYKNAERYFKRAIKIDRDKDQGYLGLIDLYESLSSENISKVKKEYAAWKSSRTDDEEIRDADWENDF